MKIPILHVRCTKNLSLGLKPCREKILGASKAQKSRSWIHTKHLESFSASGSLILPSNSQCVLPPSMGTMPSFFPTGKSTQVALLRPVAESHGKDLIDTFDRNLCQERQQGFISEGASTVPDIGRWRGVEREVATSAAEAWRNIIQLKVSMVELRRRLEH